MWVSSDPNFICTVQYLNLWVFFFKKSNLQHYLEVYNTTYLLMQSVATSAFHSIKQMLYYQPLSLLVSTAKFLKQMLYYQPLSLLVSTAKFLKQMLYYQPLSL